jgi:DNA-binding PadR family transcriptional regulator
MNKPLINELYLGFMRVHILHHASRERVYGAWLMEELGSHGYAVGPGTLYPMLHRMEASGLLDSDYETVDGKRRRYYRATHAGLDALEKARGQIMELVKEINEE